MVDYTFTSDINRVEQGNLGYHKSLGNGLFELRFTLGAGYRIYFGIEENTIIILLNGGSKASQKKDIGRAHVYWADYQER